MADLAAALAAALQQHRAGRLDEAGAAYRAILNQHPEQPDCLQLLGVIERQAGRPAAAVALIERALARHPDHAEAHCNLGNALEDLGRSDQAAAHFARAAALRPILAEAHYGLANGYFRAKRHAAAAAAYERALKLRADWPEAENNLGSALDAQGLVEAAIVHFRRVVELAPAFVEAHNNLGSALLSLGRPDEAAASLERAAALRPDLAEIHYNLGNVRKVQGRDDDAVACYERAVALNPRHAKALMNMGTIRYAERRRDEAIALFRRALEAEPEMPSALANLGVALQEEGRMEEAIALYGRALAGDPDHARARLLLCMAQLPVLYQSTAEIAQCRAAYAEELGRLCATELTPRAVRDLADAVGSAQPFYLAYQGEEDCALQSRYGEFLARVMAARYPQAPLPPPPAAGEQLRVGIVSGFFHSHSNWKMPIRGWLTQLDRARFALYGYSTGRIADGETRAAAALCRRFVAGPLPLEAWRAAILADRPHVLIYPEIGMDPIATQLAAQRLARVQCNSWGHPDTSGLPTLDYYLSSALMEPADGERHYRERLVRLANLGVYCESTAPPPAQPARGSFGLRPGATLFWCGQSLFKYLPQYDAVFPRIARDAGDCQFLFIAMLKSEHITERFRARIAAAFAAVGLDAERHCVMLPYMNAQRFAESLAVSDLFLDSIGWSGCNSCLESLAHDLPIVTLEGPLMRGRHSAAMLRMMGLGDMVAAGIEEYVAAAIHLAQAPDERRAAAARVAASKHRVYRDRAAIADLEAFLIRAAAGAA